MFDIHENHIITDRIFFLRKEIGSLMKKAHRIFHTPAGKPGIQKHMYFIPVVLPIIANGNPEAYFSPTYSMNTLNRSIFREGTPSSARSPDQGIHPFDLRGGVQRDFLFFLSDIRRPPAVPLL